MQCNVLAEEEGEEEAWREAEGGKARTDGARIQGKLRAQYESRA